MLIFIFTLIPKVWSNEIDTRFIPVSTNPLLIKVEIKSKKNLKRCIIKTSRNIIYIYPLDSSKYVYFYWAPAIQLYIYSSKDQLVFFRKFLLSSLGNFHEKSLNNKLLVLKLIQRYFLWAVGISLLIFIYYRSKKKLLVILILIVFLVGEWIVINLFPFVVLPYKDLGWRLYFLNTKVIKLESKELPFIINNTSSPCKILFTGKKYRIIIKGCRNEDIIISSTDNIKYKGISIGRFIF